MKRKNVLLLSAVIALGAMFTACGNDNTGGAMTDTQGAESSVSSDMNRMGTVPNNGDGSLIGDDNAQTGDIDGDGFIEDVAEGAENIVEDAADGAEDILDDIAPNADNDTANTTVK